MGWNGTKTWAVSDTLTASDLNSYLRDNTAYLFQKAEVAMKKGATSLATTVTTAISFTAGTDDLFDTFGMHVSGNPTRLSAISGQLGTYWCYANCVWANNTTGRRLAVLRRDGSTEIARDDRQTNANGESANSVGGPTSFTSAGQYLELLLEQESGGNLNYTVLSFGMWHVGS